MHDDGGKHVMETEEFEYLVILVDHDNLEGKSMIFPIMGRLEEYIVTCTDGGRRLFR